MFWSCGSDRIELQMTKRQAQSASHSGSCDEGVLALSDEPKIARQLAKIDPQTLAAELKEYGAWDDEDLADHEQNLQRILWIAAGDIVDGNY